MKKLISICLTTLLSFVGLIAKADEEHTIVLGNSAHPTMAQVIVDGCTLTVRISEPDNDEKVKLSFNISNTDDTKFIYLFHKALNEKELKNVKPTRLRYSKLFPGQSGTRVTEICTYNPAVNRKGKPQIVFLQPNNNEYLFSLIPMENNDTLICRIPIYTAKKGKKSIFFGTKNELMEMKVVKLNVKIELGPDAGLEDITGQVDSMVTKISQTTITVCKHSGTSHHPSEDAQKEELRKSIKDLQDVIYKEIRNRNISQGTKLFERFEEQNKRLTDINIDELVRIEECPLAPIAHTCGCSASIRRNYNTLEKIYNALDDYYQKIYNGKLKKEDVMKDVNMLKEHSNHIRGGSSDSDFRSGIEKYYNKINSL